MLKPLPENPYRRPDVPEGLPRVSHMCLVVGAPGCGKTSVVCQLVRAYVDAGLYTRVLAITPTFWTNRISLEHAGVKPEDAFVGVHQGVQALDEIIRRIRADNHTYKQNAAHWQAWDQHRAGQPLSTTERALLETLGRPTVRLPVPRPCLIADDVQATKLCSSRLFQSTAVRRRHICHDPQVELSIYVLSQSLKGGALPRAMRGIADLAICFPTRDPSVMRDMYSELAARCTWQEFEKIFAYATSGEGRPYLVVDMTHGFDPARTFKRTLEGEWIDPKRGDFL